MSRSSGLAIDTGPVSRSRASTCAPAAPASTCSRSACGCRPGASRLVRSSRLAARACASSRCPFLRAESIAVRRVCRGGRRERGCPIQTRRARGPSGSGLHRHNETVGSGYHQRSHREREAAATAWRCGSRRESGTGPRATRRARASLRREAAATRQRSCSIKAPLCYRCLRLRFSARAGTVQRGRLGRASVVIGPVSACSRSLGQ